MKALDEQGRPIIHIEDPDAGNERERWVMVMGSDGIPESLVQQYVTTASGSPHVRAVRAIPADNFGTADLLFPARDQIWHFNSLQDCVGNSAKIPSSIIGLTAHLSA